MALSDYRLCDVCGHKAFYDANLNYSNNRHVDGIRGMSGTSCDYLGDWAVLCQTCAQTYRCVIVAQDKEDS